MIPYKYQILKCTHVDYDVYGLVAGCYYKVYDMKNFYIYLERVDISDDDLYNISDTARQCISVYAQKFNNCFFEYMKSPPEILDIMSKLNNLRADYCPFGDLAHYFPDVPTLCKYMDTYCDYDDMTCIYNFLEPIRLKYICDNI